MAVRALWFTLALLFVCGAQKPARAALGDSSSVRFAPTSGAFPLASRNATAALVIDKGDWPGVLRAARDLQADVGRVAGHSPPLAEAPPASTAAVVLVGTLGRSKYIDRLVSQGSLDVSAIRGAWEAHLMQVVSKPFPGVDQALVIVGSDKRGTIYGIYDLSQQLGVSPGKTAEWARSVLDGVRKVVTTHEFLGKGAHVLKFWMIDPGVVLERIVVDFGGVRDSYLGPPESVRVDSP